MKRCLDGDSKDYLRGKFYGLLTAKIIANSLGDDGKLCDRDFISEKIEKEIYNVHKRLMKLRIKQ